MKKNYAWQKEVFFQIDDQVLYDNISKMLIKLQFK